MEFLQEHSSVMGSVTLAAAVTMVRKMRGGVGANVTNTNNGSQKRLVWMENTSDEISQF